MARRVEHARGLVYGLRTPYDGGDDLLEVDHLAGRFKALAFPTRLKILEDLKEPRSIGDLHVTTTEDGRERPLTREGVRHHVIQLVDAGLVKAASAEPLARNMMAYQVRPAGLFHLSETLVHMANPTTKRPPNPTDAPAWVRTEKRTTRVDSPWPKLAIVNGVGRGDVCELEPRGSEPPMGWVIGSDDDCDIVLPYDESVSERHAEVSPSEDGLELVDYRTSGPTYLNWRPVERGQREALSPGDVLGVGSTLLVLQSKQRPIQAAKVARQPT